MGIISISVKQQGQVTIIEMTGELDSISSPEAQEEIRREEAVSGHQGQVQRQVAGSATAAPGLVPVALVTGAAVARGQRLASTGEARWVWVFNRVTGDTRTLRVTGDARTDVVAGAAAQLADAHGSVVTARIAGGGGG